MVDADRELVVQIEPADGVAYDGVVCPRLVGLENEMPARTEELGDSADKSRDLGGFLEGRHGLPAQNPHGDDGPKRPAQRSVVQARQGLHRVAEEVRHRRAVLNPRHTRVVRVAREDWIRHPERPVR